MSQVSLASLHLSHLGVDPGVKTWFVWCYPHANAAQAFQLEQARLADSDLKNKENIIGYLKDVTRLCQNGSFLYFQLFEHATEPTLLKVFGVEVLATARKEVLSKIEVPLFCFHSVQHVTAERVGKDTRLLLSRLGFHAVTVDDLKARGAVRFAWVTLTT